MKKNQKSIACPECKSIDVDVMVGYINAEEKVVDYEDTPAFEYSKDMVMDCCCNECRTKYSVNQGTENYTVLRKPLYLTGCGDVTLLSIYTSQFNRDFKLVRMSPSLGREIVMAYVEDEEYPVVMPEVKGIEKDLPKVKSLIFNTWMSRNK